MTNLYSFRLLCDKADKHFEYHKKKPGDEPKDLYSHAIAVKVFFTFLSVATLKDCWLVFGCDEQLKR